VQDGVQTLAYLGGWNGVKRSGGRHADTHLPRRMEWSERVWRVVSRLLLTQEDVME